MPVIIRPALAADVPQILSIINRFAEMNVMLPRTEDSVRQTIADWLVAAYDEEPPPWRACRRKGAAYSWRSRRRLWNCARLPSMRASKARGWVASLSMPLCHRRMQGYTQISPR